MSDAYRTMQTEDQRLQILRYLGSQPAYSAHEHLIRDALGRVGHTVSAAAVRSHLAWLDALPAPAVALSGTGLIQVATLTQRGDDIARGAAHEPGIARPRPGQ